MSQFASAVLPGMPPSVVAALVRERLSAVARHYDDAAQLLAEHASRIAALADTHGAWEGPGARSFRAHAERHERDLRHCAHRCQETAHLVRAGAVALAERIAAVEGAAQVGAPVVAALTAVLGVGSASGHPASAPWGGAP